MGLIINTNVPSLIAQRNLAKNTTALNQSFERLASGLRINRAADDAAGLSISDTLQTQIRGNQKAVANAQDGANILQIAEGALGVIGENLQRIRELTVQAANDTNATNERRAIAQEIVSRCNDISRIANTTRGNNVYLLNGSSSDFKLQIGANASEETNVLNIGSVFVSSQVTALGITVSSITASTGGYMVNNTRCRDFLTRIDNALSNVNQRRSSLGALQNRLQSTIESLTVSIENLQSNDSRIRNLDIASESANLTRNQILQQSALSVLSQANQAPTLALKLLG